MKSDYDVAVIGAGAAGLLAAARAAERGRPTLLLEKNRKAGIKILMSGGTRCNLTHAVEARGIVEAFGPPGRFLHSALAAFSPHDLVALIEAEGVRTKVESTGKIFPTSDKASDVLAALLRRLQRSGATLALGEALRTLERVEGGFHLVTTRRTLEVGRVVITTGGLSYPGCGTTGDGYTWLARLGHTIIPPTPALVPLTTNDGWVHALQGVTVPDVRVQVKAIAGGGSARQSFLAERCGSFLFTHFGLSGPAVLDLSRSVTAHARPETLVLECDLLPAMAETALDAYLRDRCQAEGRRQVASILEGYLPRRLGETLLSLAGIAPAQKAAALAREGRQALVRAVKHLDIPVSGTLGFKKAEVTAGGVSLEEVDSGSMESRRVPGLYLAGEILDLDGPIGGYNFQAAFSTGWLAGEHV